MSKQGSGVGSLYRRQGETVWYGAVVGHDGKRKYKSTRTTCKATARRILNRWADDEAQRAAGLIDPAAEAYRDADLLPIARHLEAWRAHLEAKNGTPTHPRNMHAAAKRLVERAGIERLSGLTVKAVQGAMADMLAEGLAPRTVNYGRTAARGFARWVHRSKLTREDRLAHLPTIREQADKRRERRALTPEEAELLVRWVEESGPVYGGTTGRERAAVYRVALGTGFRAGELQSLTRADFDLMGCTVRLGAASAKNREDTYQPIRRELADWLRAYFDAEGIRGGAKALRLPGRTADAVRLDIRRSRAHWCRETDDAKNLLPLVERLRRYRSGLLRVSDDAGRSVDFHALRVSFITHLIAGGANAKVAQELARHSDPKLTLGTYTRLGLNDSRRALDALPALAEREKPAEAVAQATGTDAVGVDNPANEKRNTGRNNWGAKGHKAAHTGAQAASGLRLSGAERKSARAHGLGGSAHTGARQNRNSPARIRTEDQTIMSRLL